MVGRLVVAVTFVATVSTAALLVAQSEMRKEDRDLCLRMLADVRQDLEKNYYDLAFRGIDIAARFKEAAERLTVAASPNEAIDIIANTLFLLNDSHTTFIPPQRATVVDYGWKMAMVGDVAAVIEVTPKSDAAGRGLQPGDRVLALNRFQPTRENLWQIGYYYRVVRPQAQQHVTVRTPDGEERTYDIASRTDRREVVQITDAIEDWMAEARKKASQSRRVEPGIVVWRFTSFGDEEEMKPFLDQARDGKALILDLRGNPGGYQQTLKALVASTFDHEVHVMTVKKRKEEQREVVKPKGRAFIGPLIVLVDSRSSSAAEIYSRVVQLEKRGVVVGDRTAGAVMGSLTFSHSFGIRQMVFYGASVTVSDARMSDGKSLEHVGVTPDELLLPSMADLAAGRDPVLARAVALLGGSITPEAAGRLFEQNQR